MSPPKIQGSSPVTTPKPIAAPPPVELSPTGKALKDLGSGPVSGKSLADVISKQARGDGLGAKFDEIKKFVDGNKNLSPEAKKVFETFKGQVELAKANRQDSIDFRSANKLDRALQTAARPADVNAKLPEAKIEDHDHDAGYGVANGKADLGDKLKYGNKAMPSGANANGLKESDLDPKEGDYIVNKKEVHTSPLKLTNEQLDQQLAKQFPGGVTFKPPFKDPNGREAALAKNALLVGSPNAERGAENDLILDTGVKGSPKPTLMTTRTDKAGAVTVEIVGTTPPATKANFTSIDDAKKAFKKDFGMEIADAPSTVAGKQADPSLKDWSLEELNKMHDGFSQMSGDEKKALDGVKLERRTIVPGHSTWAAEFKSDLGHKPGTKEPIRKDVLIMADSAFKGDGGAFVGDAKNPQFPSVRTALHEAGHAVENKAQRDAQLANETAKFNYNTAVTDHAKLSKSWDGAYGKLNKADKAAAKDFDASFKDLEAKRAALANAPADKVADRYADVIKAQNKITTDFNALPSTHPLKKQASDLRDSSTNMAIGYAKTVADTGKTLADKTKAGGVSAQEAKFEKYVKDNSIPEITDYAVSGSRHENFAEAYSLYKTDPEWMKTNSPLLFKYFKDGEHLKD